MASYITYLGDKQVLLEAPVSSALSKSESEVKADPRKAIQTIMETIKTIAVYMGDELGPSIKNMGAAFEVNFAVRADTAGMVMVSEATDKGQFRVTVRWMPMAPRPAGPPPGAAPAGPPRLQGPQGS